MTLAEVETSQKLFCFSIQPIPEPITVELSLTNPLQIGLCLQQVHLCWELDISDGDSKGRVTNHPSHNNEQRQPDDYIETCALDFISLDVKQIIVVR